MQQCCCQDLFLGLETKTFKTWTKWTRVHSSLETMVSRAQHWLHQFQLVTQHSLKGATNYGNRPTGVGTKHAVLRPRPRPLTSGLETETWTKWTRVHASLETMVSRSQHWGTVQQSIVKPWNKWKMLKNPPQFLSSCTVWQASEHWACGQCFMSVSLCACRKWDLCIEVCSCCSVQLSPMFEASQWYSRWGN